jgi:anti-sigma B factor antagonist
MCDEMTSDAQFETIRTHQSGGVLLRARGEIDVATAPEFHAALAQLIGGGAEILIVDMSEVSFIDSTGLGVLVSAEKESRAAGHELRLVVTQPHVTKLLALTGLDEVFTVVSSPQDAVKA